jgi:N-acetylglucosamine-6-phosphate deacetylase
MPSTGITDILQFMIVLSGADIVQPAGIESGTLVLEGERIVEVRPGAMGAMGAVGAVDLRDHIVLPGFIDVHVHGVEGVDTLDGGEAVAAIAARLPKFGVTAFCPTTVACAPDALRVVLRQVASARNRTDAPASARVLAAHLESNFINPEYRGAQPAGCLRLPPSQSRSRTRDDVFDGHDLLAEIESAGDSVGIVTLAPELDGALDLIRRLVSNGRRVSLGHSGATLAQARDAIDAGARQATHLFNRMPPLGHREPGLAGAVLTSTAVAAEIICDGVHVHRDMVRLAIDAKGAPRVMAITDGVAAAGLPDGSSASLGGRAIQVRNSAAYLDDGTLAGSVATMESVFRFLVRDVGVPLQDAAQLCATTQASELGLRDTGSIVKGAIADLVVIDRTFTVKQTYIGGHLAYSAM